MKHIFLLLCLHLIFVNKNLAQENVEQKIDSLLIELKKVKNDSTKINILYNLGIQNIINGNFEIAMEQNKNALTLAQKLNNKDGIINASNNIGNIYHEYGNYPEALKYHLQSLKLSKEVNDKHLIANAYNNIGRVYFALEDYKLALENDNAALKLRIEDKDTVGIAMSYGNIGIIYHNTGDDQKAIEYYTIEKNLHLKTGDKRALAGTYNNLGSIFYDQKNYPEVLKYFQASLKIKEELGDLKGIANSYNNMGMLYFTWKKYDVSKQWFLQGLEKSKSLGILIYIQDAYAGLTLLDSATGNFKRVFENYKLFTSISDSLFNKENTIKLTQIEMNHEFEKQKDSVKLINDKEIAIRDATLASNKREKWAMAGSILLLTAIGALLYKQNKTRKQNNKKLLQLNQELDSANKIKTRFFSILNHDLRSPVANLIHYLHLQKESPELLDEVTKNRLEQKSIQGAENLLVTMEDLLLWSKGQMENFSPKPALVAVEHLFEDTKRVFSGYPIISFEYHNPESIEIFTDENYLKTIIRNLTSNAINAFSLTQNPTIIWKAFKENGKTVLSITDNGPGADSEKFKALYDENEVVGIKSGLGLHLIRDLAKAINCTINVNSQIDMGTTFTIHFEEV